MGTPMGKRVYDDVVCGEPDALDKLGHLTTFLAADMIEMVCEMIYQLMEWGTDVMVKTFIKNSI